MKEYLILAQSLNDGKYRTPTKLKWHEKLRIKLAIRLFKSIPKPNDLEIITTTGVINEGTGEPQV